MTTPTNETDSGAVSLTPRAQQALAFARKEAERLNHTYVGAEHLLLGLLSVDSSAVVKVLKSLGVDITAARSAVEREVQPESPTPIETQLPYTPRVTKILDSAKLSAKRFQNRFIGIEHILLALLEEDDRTVAGRILIQRFGLKLPEMKAAIEKELEKGLTTKEGNPSTGQKF